MLNKSITMALAVIGGVALLSPAKANPVIFDNGVVDPNVVTIRCDPIIGLLCADDFMLAPHSTITDFHWWGLYATANTPTEPDNFIISILADIGGAPPASLETLAIFLVGDVGRVDTGLDRLGFDIYEFWVDIEPLKLGAGTFWLSILNDTTADEDDNWFWASSAVGGNAMISDGFSWFPVSALGGDDIHFAFNITGRVPEPGTLALFGFGLLGLGLARRRKKTA